MKIEDKVKRIINYKEPRIPKERCNNCSHSYCVNPGAYVTFLNCKVLDEEIKKLDKKKFNPHLINETYGICDRYDTR